MKKGIDAPPAIDAKLPRAISALSTPSEYLKSESNETGFIFGLLVISRARSGFFKSFEFYIYYFITNINIFRI
jgi:hypothetical protein